MSILAIHPVRYFVTSAGDLIEWEANEQSKSDKEKKDTKKDKKYNCDTNMLITGDTDSFFEYITPEKNYPLIKDHFIKTPTPPPEIY